MTLEEGVDKPVVVVGIGGVETEGTTIVAVQDCVPVVFASIDVRVVVTLSVVAGIDAAVVAMLFILLLLLLLLQLLLLFILSLLLLLLQLLLLFIVLLL